MHEHPAYNGQVARGAKTSPKAAFFLLQNANYECYDPLLILAVHEGPKRTVQKKRDFLPSRH
jgi:hypothetical protein